MSWLWVSPSPFLPSSSHTTQTTTYSDPNLNFLQYTIQILVPHMWSAQVVCVSKNRPHSASFVGLAWSPKHVLVHWVGISFKFLLCERTHSALFVLAEKLPFPLRCPYFLYQRGLKRTLVHCLTAQLTC